MLETARILGVSQTFALGKYGPRADAALAEAEQMVEDYRMACTEVAAQVRTAWADYYAALREKEVHNKHLDLMKALVDIAETKYTNGKVSQQDVLEGQTGTSMLHVSLADSGAAAEAAKAALVELTGAEPPAPTVTATPLEMTLDAVVAQAMANRPDVRGAEAAIRRAASMQALAARERTIPDVTLQLEYLQMPSEDDAWAATLGVNIPWFSSKRGAEERAAGHELDAARRSREAVERAVRREVTAAWHRLKAALRTHDSFTKDLVPRAEQTLEVARSNYEKERVDFLRFLRSEQELRTMELEAARALARVETAWAELERAAGADLRSKP
jgi:outer membrane protein TolC